jgi:DNA-binding winged helix-turn-helix (wHTH) protein
MTQTLLEKNANDAGQEIVSQDDLQRKIIHQRFDTNESFTTQLTMLRDERQL